MKCELEWGVKLILQLMLTLLWTAKTSDNENMFDNFGVLQFVPFKFSKQYNEIQIVFFQEMPPFFEVRNDTVSQKRFDQYSNKDSSRNSGNYKSVSWSNGKFPIGSDIRSYKGISSKLNWKKDQLISITRRSIQLKNEAKMHRINNNFFDL